MSQNAAFEPTSWSHIASLTNDEGADARAAHEQLCAAYWYPLYAYVRRSGHEAEEARDLTQGFFARLFRKESLCASRSRPGAAADAPAHRAPVLSAR